MTRIKWNKEYDDFLIKNTSGMYLEELTKAFNENFKLNASKLSIKQRKIRLGLKSGTRGFRKGHTPYNKKPIGSERIHNGRILVKVAEPNVWKEKSRVIYEEYHKVKIPKGNKIIFLNNDPLDFDPSNLKMVSREEMLIMNNHKLRYNHKELTETGCIIAKIINKRKELNNERV